MKTAEIFVFSFFLKRQKEKRLAQGTAWLAITKYLCQGGSRSVGITEVMFVFQAEMKTSKLKKID